MSQVQLVALASLLTGVHLSAQCETGLLLSSDTDANDRFGAFVALDGDVAVATAVDKDDLGSGSGAAYVFERIGGQWIEVAKLVGSDVGIQDTFGSSADVDGERIVIGAEHDEGMDLNSGAVYVFERLAGNWTEVAKIIASDGTSTDVFGRSVDLEGNRLAIGARNADGPVSSPGAVYIYSYTGGTWVEEGKVVPPAEIPTQDFGDSVSLAGDKLLVGAPRAFPFGVQAGAAFAFERIDGAWLLAASLAPTNPGVDDFFGTNVVLVGGDALVSAPRSDEVASDVGLVYVFDSGTWLPTGKLLPDDTKEGLRFGQFLSHDHASRVVVTTGLSLPTKFAGAYLFEQHSGLWIHSGKIEITTPPTSFAARSPALDGTTLLLGDSKDVTLGFDAGAVEIYHVTGLLEPFGQGNPTLLGTQLGLYGSGCVAPGGTVTFRTNYGFPGFAGVLAGSTASMSLPFALGEIVVAPPLFVQVPHVLTGPPGGLGQGEAALEFPLPTNPALSGLHVYMQAGYLDPFAFGGVSLTNGVHVVFGDSP